MQPLTQLPLRSGKRFIFDKAHAERVCRLAQPPPRPLRPAPQMVAALSPTSGANVMLAHSSRTSANMTVER
jgi:hypothetical protein